MEPRKKQPVLVHEAQSGLQKPATTKTKSSNMMKYISLLTLTVQSAVAVLSMRYSRTRSGPLYIPSTGVLNCELLKLVVSLFVVYRQAGSISKWTSTLKLSIINQPMDTLKVCIPSLIYVIQNNILYVAVTHLDATAYQVSYQLKIATTALFSTIVLRKKLTLLQWISLAILIIGVGLVQHNQSNSSYSEHTNVKKPGSFESASENNDKNVVYGLAAIISACFLSGFAGIYFEKIIKGSNTALWIRNVQMAVCSIPFAFIACVYNDRAALADKGYFYGYDLFVVYLIFLQVSGGFAISLIVKYADSILKGFATSLAIILSCLISNLLLDLQFTLQLAVGVCLVIGSVILYGYQEQQQPHILNRGTLQADSVGSNRDSATESSFASYCSAISACVKRNSGMVNCFSVTRIFSGVNVFSGLLLLTIITIALTPTLSAFILDTFKFKN